MRQCIHGFPKFHDARVNDWHNKVKGAIPKTLGDLKAVASRFANSEEGQARPESSKPATPAAASFATAAAQKTHLKQVRKTYAKSAGVGEGKCF